MSENGLHGRRSSTAAYLRYLLADVDKYRRQWQVHVKRAVPGELHQRALAQVIAEYLWDTGQADDSIVGLPRRLRDRVSRALSGESLSVETLNWFIGAFELSDSHSSALWSRFRGDLMATAPSLGATDVRRPLSSDAYRTRVLDEFHQIGPNRLPVAHETFQVIEALEEMSRYSFQFDTASASMEVLRGGQRGVTYANPDRPGIHAADIIFPTVLKPGDKHFLKYRAVFHYDDLPPPEFRRVLRKPVRTVAIEVRFHPECLPLRLWWGRWDDLNAEPVEKELVTVSKGGTANRLIENAQECIVGFRWEWE